MYMKNKEEQDVKQQSFIQIEIMKAQWERGIISVNDSFDNHLSKKIMDEIDYLAYVLKKRDILIQINSPGGVITDGLAIYDKILSIADHCRVHTLVTGMAASMGAALLSMGSQGCRYAHPHSTVMIHQPLTGYGPGTKINDLRNNIKSMRETEDLMTKILSSRSNLNQEEMRKACDRDNYLNAQSALDIGLIDHVIVKIPDIFLKTS